jgi:serine protease Do
MQASLSYHCPALRRFAAILFVTTFALMVAAPLSAQSSAQRAAPNPLQDFNRSMEALVHKVSPSVVQILVTAFAPIEERGRSQAGVVIGRQRAIGSGVIVDPDGYILTNAHVVNGAQRLQIVIPAPLADGSPVTSLALAQGRIEEGRVVGIDTEMDLAVVKIDAKGLPALPFAKYSDVRQGEVVLAFGSPQGLRNSVTMGVVSAVARQLDQDSPYVYIQTDASINPGNSGGPLVNINGELVGINAMILSESGGNEGIGFAIPCGVVSVAYPQLRKFGHLHRPEIGASVQTITPTLAAGLGLSQNSGVIVTDVTPGGSADDAGMKIQDIVLTMDARPVDSLPLLYYNLFVRQPGDKVKMEVLRGSQKVSFELAVLQPEHQMDRLLDLANPEKNLVRRLGIIGIEINDQISKALPDLRMPSGVIVVARTIEAGAADNALATGDVIHSVNGATISTLDDLRVKLDTLKPYSPLVLQIERDSKLLYMALQMP